MKPPIDSYIATFSVTLAQDADSCDSGDDQILEIKFEDAGGGLFPIISTKRWAMDDPRDLARFIRGLARWAKSYEDAQLHPVDKLHNQGAKGVDSNSNQRQAADVGTE